MKIFPSHSSASLPCSSKSETIDDDTDGSVKPTISAILTAHAEGSLAIVSLNSLNEACEFAEQRGYVVHRTIVLDRPDNATRVVFEGLEGDYHLLETDFGDQGLVRNYAVNESAGDYIAFLDGDDLWCDNWLVEAFEALQKFGPRTIAHPTFNWFFQGVASVLINIDQSDHRFAEDFLRFGNYWDAMCMAHRSVYLDNKYSQRRIKEGFAFEDWHWNCSTYESGCEHVVVPDTVHFKRRRQNSQTIEASSTRSLMPETRLTDYSYEHLADDFKSMNDTRVKRRTYREKTDYAQ